MDKYVKIQDVIEFLQVNTMIDGWGNVRLFQSLGETCDQLAKVACDDVVKVIRCKDCARRLEHETLGNVCVKNSPTLIPVKLDGFCSDAFPTKLKI